MRISPKFWRLIHQNDLYLLYCNSETNVELSKDGVIYSLPAKTMSPEQRRDFTDEQIDRQYEWMVTICENHNALLVLMHRNWQFFPSQDQIGYTIDAIDTGTGGFDEGDYHPGEFESWLDGKAWPTVSQAYLAVNAKYELLHEPEEQPKEVSP